MKVSGGLKPVFSFHYCSPVITPNEKTKTSKCVFVTSIVCVKKQIYLHSSQKHVISHTVALADTSLRYHEHILYLY